MTTYDNSYSRFIAWVKVALPLVALGILSTLFLFSQGKDSQQFIPYADVDIEQLAREQGINAPNYAGVTSDGAAISIAAKTVMPNPDDPQNMSATNLRAVIEYDGGGRIDISARGGSIDATTKVAKFNGGVHMVTSTGYEIDTSGMVVKLARTSIITDGEVTANGPLGSLQAGQMEIRQLASSQVINLLVFKNGVKLVYKPKG